MLKKEVRCEKRKVKEGVFSLRLVVSQLIDCRKAEINHK